MLRQASTRRGRRSLLCWLLGAALLATGCSAATPDPTTQPTSAPMAVEGDLPYPRIAWEGGPDYWKQFARADEAGWSDPSFFPITLWFNGIGSAEEANYDKEHGFNTYIGMSSDTPYHLFEDNDVFWIGPGLNDTFTPEARNWVGRILADEPDGTMTPEEGRAFLQESVDEAPDDGRFNYVNFTQMVISDFMDVADAEAIVNNYTDVISLDMYWYTVSFCDWDPYYGTGYVESVQQSNCRTSSSYGKSAQSLRVRDAADDRLQPLWQFVEIYNGGPGGGEFVRAITPGELKGAVMNSVINEARGILYFNQSLNGPCQGGSLVRETQVGKECAAAQVEAAGVVNDQIHELAPVINTQSYEYSFGAGLDTMLKTADGSAYVFAMIDGETRPGPRTLTLPPELHGRGVEVLFEDRTITPGADGSFTDDFAEEYTYHIYKIG